MYICVCKAEGENEQAVGEHCVSNQAGHCSSSINIFLCNIFLCYHHILLLSAVQWLGKVALLMGNSSDSIVPSGGLAREGLFFSILKLKKQFNILGDILMCPELDEKITTILSVS